MLKGIRKIGRIKLAILLSVLGSAALAIVLVRHAAAQGAIGSDHTAPSSAPAVAQPEKSASSATLTRFDAIDATDNPCTTATSFADMPGMTKTFSQAGTSGGTSKAIAMFQGEWIPNTGRALLRLVVDGVIQTGPGDTASPFAATEGGDDRTAGFNFITDNLANNASHTVKVQWASVAGDSICVDERSLVILHR